MQPLPRLRGNFIVPNSAQEMQEKRKTAGGYLEAELPRPNPHREIADVVSRSTVDALFDLRYFLAVLRLL